MPTAPAQRVAPTLSRTWKDMIGRSNLQLLSHAGGQPGSIGFKLTGKAREGEGLCRIWLRKGEPWDRYLDPRVRSDEWDVRAYRRLDSAFAVFEEFTLSTLDDIANDYHFVNADGLGALALNGDPIHDHVLRWARSVTGASEAGPAPEQAAEPAPEQAAEPAPEPAPEQAAEPAPEPAPEQAAEPAAPAPASANHTAALSPQSGTQRINALAEGWDEIDAVATEASGDHPAASDES